jgi:hypothetical protein
MGGAMGGAKGGAMIDCAAMGVVMMDWLHQ